jgi:hypothetical protein
MTVRRKAEAADAIAADASAEGVFPEGESRRSFALSTTGRRTTVDRQDAPAAVELDPRGVRLRLGFTLLGLVRPSLRGASAKSSEAREQGRSAADGGASFRSMSGIPRILSFAPKGGKPFGLMADDVLCHSYRDQFSAFTLDSIRPCEKARVEVEEGLPCVFVER